MCGALNTHRNIEYARACIYFEDNLRCALKKKANLNPLMGVGLEFFKKCGSK